MTWRSYLMIKVACPAWVLDNQHTLWSYVRKHKEKEYVVDTDLVSCAQNFHNWLYIPENIFWFELHENCYLTWKWIIKVDVILKASPVPSW